MSGLNYKITAQYPAECIFLANNNEILIIFYHISVSCCENCAFWGCLNKIIPSKPGRI